VGLLINTLHIFGVLEKSPICVGLFKVVSVSIVKMQALLKIVVCLCVRVLTLYTHMGGQWSMCTRYTGVYVYVRERERESVCVCVRKYT